MASANIAKWIRKNLEFVGDRVLDVGSKQYNDISNLDLHKLLTKKCPASLLTGFDISEGPGVDVVIDITNKEDLARLEFEYKCFDTIFCISVLEHIPDIFSACKNLSALLRPGGALFISVPFVFRYHGYPRDFWRFTPESITYLFPDVDFLGYKHSTISTLQEGDSRSLEGNGINKMNRFIMNPRDKEEKLVRKKAKEDGINLPYSLSPSMINMLGIKR
jgi:SAM-dependent methyltransferase